MGFSNYREIPGAVRYIREWYIGCSRKLKCTVDHREEFCPGDCIIRSERTIRIPVYNSGSDSRHDVRFRPVCFKVSTHFCKCHCCCSLERHRECQHQDQQHCKPSASEPFHSIHLFLVINLVSATMSANKYVIWKMKIKKTATDCCGSRTVMACNALDSGFASHPFG